jgi:NTE family protein
MNARLGQVVLVLPGGGALGAYQAGVYEALSSTGFEPDWVIGTSIGAINAALIAGNVRGRRVDQVRAFWERVGQSASPGRWSIVANGVPAFFTPRMRGFLDPCANLGLDEASYYSTEPLRRTLNDLVRPDLFGRRGNPRITVGAVGVRSGSMTYFDSDRIRIGIDHVMASGALPPAFPAVRIDGEAYWDSGVYSNTPIEPVFDDCPRRSSLVFAVNVWQPRAAEPRSIWEVMSRQKDIQFASRADAHIEQQRKLHRMRRMLQTLAAHVPQSIDRIPRWADIAPHACDTTIHVVRLLVPARQGEDMFQDIDFGRRGIRERWTAGREDALQAIERAPWNDAFDPLDGVVVHESSASRD